MAKPRWNETPRAGIAIGGHISFFLYLFLCCFFHLCYHLLPFFSATFFCLFFTMEFLNKYTQRKGLIRNTYIFMQVREKS